MYLMYLFVYTFDDDSSTNIKLQVRMPNKIVNHAMKPYANIQNPLVIIRISSRVIVELARRYDPKSNVKAQLKITR